MDLSNQVQSRCIHPMVQGSPSHPQQNLNRINRFYKAFTPVAKVVMFVHSFLLLPPSIGGSLNRRPQCFSSWGFIRGIKYAPPVSFRTSSPQRSTVWKSLFMAFTKLPNVGSLSLQLPFVVVVLLNLMLITLFLHIMLPMSFFVFWYILMIF